MSGKAFKWSAQNDKKRYMRRWVATILYTLFIYATLPLFPTLWGFATQLFPNGVKAVAYGFVPFLGFLFFAYFLFVKKESEPFFYVWTSLFALSHGPVLYFYCEFTAERFHFAEYGLLVLLTYRCLKLRMNSLWIYPVIMAYTFAVGFVDEIIQGILPNRAYEFKDITINWAACFLATGLIAGVTWKGFASAAIRPKLRTWAVAIALLMVAGNGALFYQKYWRPPLNVILLSVDTFRPDHLRSYGYHRKTTPFLDMLAAKGVLFKNVISSAPWTSPGMISLFTGLYPTSHGVEARGRSLLQGTPTLFKISKENGFKVPNIAYLTEILNFANLGLGPKQDAYFEKAAEPGDELLEWLDDHHRNQFFVWYHYRFLHLPYDTDKPHRIFLTDQMKRDLDSENLRTVRRESVIPYGSVNFTKEEAETVKALYDGQLRALDEFISRLYSRMTRWKLHRNTLLVITADHGEEFFEHGFIGHASTAIHATMYDEVLKIPLIFYAPSRLKERRVIESQVRQVDIMPTILDIVGLPIPESLHGVSLFPKMNGLSGGPPLPAISESVSGGYQSSPEQEKVMLRSYRTEDFKLICRIDGKKEICRLYDLKKDPGEKTDVFDSETAIGSHLKTKLDAQIAQMQTQRLTMLSKENAQFTRDQIPKNAKLEKATVLSPKGKQVIQISKMGGRLVVSWTGDKNLTYVIEYDVGKGWRNLKGTIPVQGNSKTFGPLPKEAWEPLPYWNPYRIRISPYGLEEYWSDWVEFSIKTSEES